MSSLPTWAVYVLSFGTPLAAFLGAVIGHAVSRRGASELDRRAKREETMRTLRWASELAVAPESERAQVGIAALDALSVSRWLQEEDQVFIDAVLDALVAEDVRAYRESDGAVVLEVDDPPAPEGSQG